MDEPINRHRRRFFGTAAVTIAAAQLSATALAEASGRNVAHLPPVKPGTNVSFASLTLMWDA
jgi:hypothetical protein